MKKNLYLNIIDKALSLSRNVKKILLISFDLIFLYFLAILSYVIRINYTVLYKQEYFYYSLIFPTTFIFVFYIYGYYNEVSRFVRSENLYKQIQACLFIILIIYTLGVIFNEYLFIPRSIPIIFFSLVNIYLLVRFFIFSKLLIKKNVFKKNIAIIGIDNEIISLTSYIEQKGQYKILAFIDDSQFYKNSKINGIKIYGINEFFKEFNSENIDFIVFSENYYKIEECRQICLKNNINIKKIKDYKELLFESISLEKINSLLLTREEISASTNIIKEIHNNKNIIVTGAAGSIGSEIVKILYESNSVNKIILIDQSEYGLFELKNTLKKININNNINTKLDFVLLNLIETYSLQKIFESNDIDVIYHAAAYKHVNIVESEINNNYAIKNNVLSTYNLVKFSSNYSVKNFILISSDKAVNPSNVMGLTKRISELIVQNKSLDCKSEYKIVRFGNVIASSGSVVNTFIDQFQKGGPVTLTHKEVERYFMTINEAAGLVLQTLKHAGNGNILFLDMGKPVKIYNIVRKIAEALGKKIRIINQNEKYIKNKNFNEIDLIITGLKKGEKMKEELTNTNKDKNLIYPTSNQKILFLKEKIIYNDNIDKLINKILDNNYNFDIKKLYKDFI